MEDVKVFVTGDADFCLLLQGDEKKLMSFEEVVSVLEKFVSYKNEVGITYNVGERFPVLITKKPHPGNFAEVCERFKHILWPENVPA